MIREDHNIDEPLLKAVYVNKATEPINVEPGKVLKQNIFEDCLAPRLYENIKKPEW